MANAYKQKSPTAELATPDKLLFRIIKQNKPDYNKECFKVSKPLNIDLKDMQI